MEVNNLVDKWRKKPELSVRVRDEGASIYFRGLLAFHPFARRLCVTRDTSLCFGLRLYLNLYGGMNVTIHSAVSGPSTHSQYATADPSAVEMLLWHPMPVVERVLRR